MNIIEIIVIAIGVAMDAFAVSVCAGTSRFLDSPRAKFRISFHFGLFQFIMPVLGWFLGIQVVEYFALFDHWVAFGLLSYIGFKMVHSGLDPEAKTCDTDPSRKMMLVMLSVATSIDALAVGLSLAMLQVNILYPSIVIGSITFCFSLIGIYIGKKAGLRFGSKMEIVGGAILILIALKILGSHLLT